jgi:hypothetical protein
MEIAGWFSVLIGVVLLTWSSHDLISGNRGRRVPYWTRAHQTPSRSIWLRVMGVIFLIASVTMLSATLGYWSAAVVLGAFVPGTALIALHNRRLAAHA